MTVRGTRAMIAGMTPTLMPGHFAFLSMTEAEAASHLATARAIYREAEGVSLILPAEPGAPMAMRCITLNVLSALDGVGLTAAVAARLTREGIACNMVAAFYHDHVYVPADRAEDALAALRALQDEAR